MDPKMYRLLAKAERKHNEMVEYVESDLARADNHGADDPGSTAPVPAAPWES